ncbi:unnamed protein product [Spodoptera exigua]|nr:unnamed protein product [Spodoptera exigua]
MFRCEQSHKSYRPLTVLTFRWNYAIHGLQPAGYHLVNLLLHALVSLLYYRSANEQMDYLMESNQRRPWTPVTTEELRVADLLGIRDLEVLGLGRNWERVRIITTPESGHVATLKCVKERAHAEPDAAVGRPVLVVSSRTAYN